MKTQRHIYDTIYKNKLFEYSISYDEDKASRKANMYAVKHTWRLYNEQTTQSKFCR